MNFNYLIDQKKYRIELNKTDDGYLVKIGEKSYQVSNSKLLDGVIDLEINGAKVIANWAIDGKRKRWIGLNGREWLIEKASTSKRSGKADAKNRETSIYAPMPGQVRKVLIAEGDEVSSGQQLVLLEAMKMEIRITSPGEGKICRLLVEEGQQVDKDDLLLEIE